MGRVVEDETGQHQSTQAEQEGGLGWHQHQGSEDARQLDRGPVREVKPWSQASLRAAARPWACWPTGLPGPLSLAPPGFPAALAGGSPAPQSQENRASDLSCTRSHGSAVSAAQLAADQVVQMMLPHAGGPPPPPRPATRPVLASSFLTGLQPLRCLPASRLNSPSPSRPRPVVLWAVRPVRQPGSAGPAHRLSLVSKGPAGWWLWPHQSAGSVLRPEP